MSCISPLSFKGTAFTYTYTLACTLGRYVELINKVLVVYAHFLNDFMFPNTTNNVLCLEGEPSTVGKIGFCHRYIWIQASTEAHQKEEPELC